MATEYLLLRDLVDIVGGGTPRRSEPRYWGGDVPWATVKDLSKTRISHTTEFITRIGLENSSATIVPAGTIVIATRIVPGRAALAAIDLAINQDLKGLLPCKKIDPAYLTHFMHFVEPRLASKGAGSTVKGITLETLGRVRVPIPALGKQRQIAALLDKADAVVRKRFNSVRILEEFLRSSYMSIVGPHNPNYSQWPQFEIRDLAEPRKNAMRTGPFGSALRHAEFTPQGEVAVIGIDNTVGNDFRWGQSRFITRERYDAHFRRYTVRAGDVLITIMGTTGRSAVVPEDIGLAISTKHLAVITVNRSQLYPEYLSYAIRADPSLLTQISHANRGAIMSGLNLGLIRRLKVRLPPLSDQRKFVQIMRCSRVLKPKVECAIQQQGRMAESLKQSLFEDTAS